MIPRLVVAVVCDDIRADSAPGASRDVRENLRFADDVRLVARPALASGRSPLRLLDVPRGVVDEAGGAWLLLARFEERVSLALRSEILELIARDPGERPSHVATIRPRRHLLGRFLEHGGLAEPEPRLFALPLAADDRTLAELESGASGAIALEQPLVELGDRTLDARVKRLNAGSDIPPAAGDGGSAPTTCPLALFAGEAVELLRRLVPRSGWRDGVPGLIAAVCDGMERIVLEAKRREARERDSHGAADRSS